MPGQARQARKLEMELAKQTARIRWGIPLMTGAAAVIAATSLIAKALGIDGEDVGLHPFQISAGRFFFGLASVCLFLLVRPRMRPTFENTRWDWHMARSLCGWLGVTAMFAAVARMPVAEATAISFLNPLVTMGLAVLLLGEHLERRKIIAALLAVAGAILILRPGTEAFRVAGLFALAAAGFLGLEAIFIKRLSDSEPPLRILLINNSMGAIVSLTVSSFVWTWPSQWQWALLACLGAVMVCGQALFIQAMKRGEASLVIPAFYSALVFAALFDFALYHVVPGWPAIVGGALILFATVMLSRARPQN